MDVVLLERIEKLGKLGEVVSVKPGYARNYLIPQGRALRASRDNIARFEAERSEREARDADRRGRAHTVAGDLEGTFVALVRQASENLHLYGSVKAADIARGLVERGFEVDRRHVVLSRPIKTLGLHEVTIMLHPEVAVTVVANVARSEDEAAFQEQTGRAVGRRDEDDADAGDDSDDRPDAPDGAEAGEESQPESAGDAAPET